MKIKVAAWRDPDGWSLNVPAVIGATASGATLEEAIELLKLLLDIALNSLEPVIEDEKARELLGEERHVIEIEL
jgi:predicted RNase H-like HicB family nuclease